jgi:hypothetical protein
MFWLILLQECCGHRAAVPWSIVIIVVIQRPRGKGRLCLTRIIHRGHPTLLAWGKQKLVIDLVEATLRSQASSSAQCAYIRYRIYIGEYKNGTR